MRTNIKVWLVIVGMCGSVVLKTSLAAPTNDVLLPVSFTGVGEVRAAVWTITPMAGSDTLRLRVESSGFSAVPVSGGYSLRIPGQAASAKAGSPDVPHLSKLLPGVNGARAVLSIHGVDPTNLTDIVLVPAEGFRLDDSTGLARKLHSYRQADPVVFGQNRFWPTELGWVEEGAIGTQNVVRVECCPVQYNPVTKVLRFHQRIEGELRFEPR